MAGTKTAKKTDQQSATTDANRGADPKDHNPTVIESETQTPGVVEQLTWSAIQEKLKEFETFGNPIAKVLVNCQEYPQFYLGKYGSATVSSGENQAILANGKKIDI